MQMILNEALVLNGLLGAFLAGLFNGGVLGLAAVKGMRGKKDDDENGKGEK